MNPVHGRVMPVLLAAAVLVGGANLAAYAANGQPLLLGHRNKETKTAIVKNAGSGPALSLTSKSKVPSLAVSSSKLVKHLNADAIDGLSGSQVQNKAYRYAVPSGGPFTTETALSVPGLPKGLWLASYSMIVNAGANVDCFFRQTQPTTAQAYTFTPATSFAGLAATAVIDTRGTRGPVTFHCQGSSYSLYSAAGDAESTITFTNLTSLARKAVTESRNRTTSHGRVTGGR